MDAIILLSLLVALAVAAQRWGYDSRDGYATAEYGSNGEDRWMTKAGDSVVRTERETIDAQRASLASVAARQRVSQAARTSTTSDEDDSWMYEDDRWMFWELDEGEKAAA